MTKSESKQLGKWIIYISLLGFIASVVMNFTRYAGNDEGALPAVSLVLIILGMSFYFPSMLEAKAGTLSTMRVVVLAIVLVFILVYVKTGWNGSAMEEFTIDNKWVYILGLAFGAKVIQRYGEDDEGGKSGPADDSEKTDSEVPPIG